MNREAHILPYQEPGGEYEPSVARCCDLSRKAENGFLLKKFQIFQYLQLIQIFFKNLSVDLIGPSGYQCVTLYNTVCIVTPDCMGWDGLRK